MTEQHPSDHEPRPVRTPGATNAVCQRCGFFPLPLEGAQPVPLLLVEDHELCETQISELVAVLQTIRDTKAFSQLSHAMQDRVRNAVKTRGIKTP